MVNTLNYSSQYMKQARAGRLTCYSLESGSEDLRGHLLSLLLREEQQLNTRGI